MAKTSKNIVITGVTRGLGRALVPHFANGCHTVIGCGRNANAIQKLAEEFGAPHDFDAVNVADAAQVNAWANNVLQRHGPPDLVINNAALLNHPARLWQVPAEEFSTVVDVNIKGVHHVCRAFLPAMLEIKHGVIVNLSSGWGRSVSPEVGPYCATKWAVEGYTQALATELPNGMAAIPLNPGIINTEMLQKCFGSGASMYHGPDEWAVTAAPFLLGLGPKDNGSALTVPA